MGGPKDKLYAGPKALGPRMDLTGGGPQEKVRNVWAKKSKHLNDPKKGGTHPGPPFGKGREKGDSEDVKDNTKKTTNVGKRQAKKYGPASAYACSFITERSKTGGNT